MVVDAVDGTVGDVREHVVQPRVGVDHIQFGVPSKAQIGVKPCVRSSRAQLGCGAGLESGGAGGRRRGGRECRPGVFCAIVSTEIVVGLPTSSI